MDEMKELDDAWDNLFTPGKEDGRPQKGAPPSVEDDLAMHGVAELRAAIAREKLIPVKSLLALWDRLPCAFVCAALVGALRHVRNAGGDNTAALDGMENLLLTKSGRPRKVVTEATLAEIQALGGGLGDPPAVETVAAVSRYLVVLQGLAQIEADTVLRLFGAGLWRGSFIREAGAQESAMLAAVDEELVRAVKRALEE